jgi:type IV secretion system protein VirB10
MKWLAELAARRKARAQPASGEATPVAGERSHASLASALSLQARATNVLALGLMAALGTGALAWYYVHASPPLPASAPPVSRAQTETVLPPLDPLDSPPRASPAPTAATPEASPAAVSVVTSLPSTLVPAAPAPAVAPNSQASPLQRRLSGAVFSNGEALPVAVAAAPGPPVGGAASAERYGELPALLAANASVTVHARLAGGQRLLLPRGAFVDCTLETAIDSTLPGMTTCITATDTFGADGSVVLLERGTKLVGETRGQVQQGVTRLFVLWTEARTPTGVIVPLDSPGTDELGRSGLSGEVERHFWQRFGAALLITTIDGAAQAAMQSTNRGAGTVIYNSSGAEGITKRNGDRIQVLVARDVDFSDVYELRHVAGGR